MVWGDGSTSSSDRQFFRSAKRGDGAGEIRSIMNAGSGDHERDPEHHGGRCC